MKKLMAKKFSVYMYMLFRKKVDGRRIKSIVWTEPDTTNLEAIAEKIRVCSEDNDSSE